MMAGDGGLETIIPTILFLQKAGANMIELGIPFSDPVADGPVIQAAGLRALQAGITLDKVLSEVEAHQKEITIPIIIMCYANPIYRLGVTKFAERCAAANIKGVIVPDAPMEEEALFKNALQPYNIPFIRFVTLTSTDERIADTLADAEGFIYAVTVNGTTGERQSYNANLFSHLQKITEQSPVPVLAGFGIANKTHIANFHAVCDGVIIGSKIVQALHDKNYAEIEALLQ